jgi:hypothetical protein
MAEQKHTPGPWSAVGAFIENRNTGTAVCKTMCRFNEEGHFPVEAEADANARLIAAAPELLEALRGFANLAEYSDIVNSMATVLRPHERAGFVESFSKARAAIAKAEG